MVAVNFDALQNEIWCLGVEEKMIVEEIGCFVCRKKNDDDGNDYDVEDVIE